MKSLSAIRRAVAGAVASILARPLVRVSTTLRPIEPLESRFLLSVANIVGTAGGDNLHIYQSSGGLNYNLNGTIVATGDDQFTWWRGLHPDQRLRTVEQQPRSRRHRRRREPRRSVYRAGPDCTDHR